MLRRMLRSRWLLHLLRHTRLITYRSTRAPVTAWDRLVDWFNGLELSENAILLSFAVVIGTLGALGVVVFYKLIDVAYGIFYRSTGDLLSRAELLAYRPLLTMVGLASAWWVMRRLGQGHDGLNIPDVQLAVVRSGGAIPSRPAMARTLASAITLGGGGSAGAEGPVAVLGSAIGSLLGRLFRFASDRVVVLVAAGAAAGISAAFNAPLAGAFFAIEEILGSYAAASFPPIVVSSVVAAVVSRTAFGNHPAFPIPAEYGYALSREVILFYPALGVAAGVMSVIFIRAYFAMETLTKRWKGPAWALPWMGGAAVGIMVYLSAGLLVGFGHLAVHLELFGRMAWTTLLMLAVGKILATSITLNAGGSGGVFTPSLYIGAATGGAFGVILADAFPQLGLHPEAYALVGMGAVVAGATAAPITGILLVFEMTNDYAIVLPLMLTTVISFLVARRLEPDSLYSGWLRRRGQLIQHGRDPVTLARLTVGAAMDHHPRLIGEGEKVAAILGYLGEREQSSFPVVDRQGRLVGMISMADLGMIARDYRDTSEPLVGGDIMQPSEALTPGDSLLDATRRLGVRGIPALPVVDGPNGRVIGLVTRGHIIALYAKAEAVESAR